FPPQPRHRVGVLRQRLGQHLDRELLLRRDVRGEVHERHATLAQLALDLVAFVERLTGQVRVGRSGLRLRSYDRGRSPLPARGQRIRWRRSGRARWAQQPRAVLGAKLGIVGVLRTACRTTIHQEHTWLRPPDLARYSASSARAKRSSGDATRGEGKVATPTLHV